MHLWKNTHESEKTTINIENCFYIDGNFLFRMIHNNNININTQLIVVGRTKEVEFNYIDIFDRLDFAINVWKSIDCEYTFFDCYHHNFLSEEEKGLKLQQVLQLYKKENGIK